ncbi:MAG: ATP-binding protein [Bacteroidales bacterium]|nr:ATP-binding protein [Bacteroidales bacterium]MBR6249606.1 ATP-binding protein [Bacteroidales bacterium]
MEENTIESLYKTSSRLARLVNTKIRRYLLDKINWSSHLIAIKGARGVGKTTLMLQRIKESALQDAALYISLDNFWFTTHSLTEVVEYHYNHGGTHLFIDEVHKYPHWQTLIKNITDEYPDLYVVYTGSSMLKIDYNEGDLSRRQVVYTLNGLSFREFMQFEGVEVDAAVSLPELLDRHQAIALSYADKVKIQPLFEKYLKCGYYPFYKRDAVGYDFRLQSVIRQILNEDLPAVEEVTYPTIQKVERMMMILAERVPQTPNMAELFRQLETNREQGLRMLGFLERAGILNLLCSESKNMKQLAKPDKILPNNTNIMYALSIVADKGTLREAFFFNQLSNVANVVYPKRGDFYVDNMYLFEVGGKNKTFEQIKDVPNSYLAVDDTEVGHHNRIPLWTFGLLY